MGNNPYLPHTQADIQDMLSTVGISCLDGLFTDIPGSLKLGRELRLPGPLSEYEILVEFNKSASQNRSYTSFLGCGSYDHIIPTVVSHVTGRSEFYTAYTPYQAEISQGILQAIFEFQTLICQITDLDVSNASLYDGSTAAYEACALALQKKRKADTILISKTIHPHIRQVLRTYFYDLDVRLVEVPFCEGVLARDLLEDYLGSRVAAVVVQSPNIFGALEDYSGTADLVHKHDALLIQIGNPLSYGILKSPGEWGADIAVGDTQVFGLPSALGGPSVGYIAARQELLRKIPGRIVGQTVDADGLRAFVLTLQAREQHIKRERATSNICSNQALAALASSVFLVALGKQGIYDLANQNLQKAHYLYDSIVEKRKGRSNTARTFILRYEQPFFNEFLLSLPVKTEVLQQHMYAKEIFPGVDLSRLLGQDYSHSILVAVTEKRTKEEMDAYVKGIFDI